MKTTILFKCHGAWSPLWQLSKEKSFEIKSHDYWANFSCVMLPPSPETTLTLQPYQEAFLDMMTKYHCADAAGYPVGSAKESNQIVFSEYQDPASFSVPSCEQMAMEEMFSKEQLRLQIARRADEVFGIWNPMDKREFCACLDGSEGQMVIARQTEDGFSIELRKAK